MALGQLFSQRVGYAVHALCFMAKAAAPGSLTTVPVLARWMRRTWPDTSETYLANIIRRLVRGDILVSRRGVAGGYSLAREPDQITLRDVVAVLEGFSSARCALAPTGRCPVQDRCPNYRRLNELQQRYADLLADITIADLTSQMGAAIPEPSACEQPNEKPVRSSGRLASGRTASDPGGL